MSCTLSLGSIIVSLPTTQPLTKYITWRCTLVISCSSYVLGLHLNLLAIAFAPCFDGYTQLAGKVDATLHDLERLMELHLNADQETVCQRTNSSVFGVDIFWQSPCGWSCCVNSVARLVETAYFVRYIASEPLTRVSYGGGEGGIARRLREHFTPVQ